jgi:hypothetical protein
MLYEQAPSFFNEPLSLKDSKDNEKRIFSEGKRLESNIPSRQHLSFEELKRSDESVSDSEKSLVEIKLIPSNGA